MRLDPAEIQRLVEIRMMHQEILFRPEPPHLWAVLDESVIRRIVGSRETMREQLDHLLKANVLAGLPDRCAAGGAPMQVAGSGSGSRRQEPAPTMTTRCTTPACGRFIHPTKDRGLTLREAATFQTFPVSYLFCGGYGSVERQIGNAVPVRMAKGLGLIASAILCRSSS